MWGHGPRWRGTRPLSMDLATNRTTCGSTAFGDITRTWLNPNSHLNTTRHTHFGDEYTDSRAPGAANSTGRDMAHAGLRRKQGGERAKWDITAQWE